MVSRHFRTLEAQSIHILREVAASFERPVLMHSAGKDSTVLLRLAVKVFYPSRLPVDTAIKRLPVVGKYLGSVIPCWNYFDTDLSPEQKRAWAIMDTFDALAPTYDNPVTLEAVRGWFADTRWTEIEVRPGGNGVVGNARRRAGAQEFG